MPSISTTRIAPFTLGGLRRCRADTVVAGKNADRQVGEDQARAFVLQRRDLFLAQRRAPDLDRGVLGTDGERQGGSGEKAEQDLGKQVLGRMLLHVVVAAREIELQARLALAGVPFQHVDDVVILAGQLQQRQAVDRAPVGRLAAALGAEDRALEAHAPAAFMELPARDPCRELPAVGVPVIDLFGHLLSAACFCRAASTSGRMAAVASLGMVKARLYCLIFHCPAIFSRAPEPRQGQ